MGGFPEGFGGHPGMGGMGGMRGRREEVDTEALYTKLGISKEASPGEIKKAFRKLAVQHHPDKGGDEDEFKAISMAYEILSDEQKRKIYDEGGLEALEGGGGGGGGEAGDIFSAFFGGRGGRGRRSGPRKGEDLVHPISMTLEHLYNGKTSKLALSRNVICETCKGSGSKTPGANTTCGGCQGQGIKLVSRQIAPGMIQQMQTHCGDCQGTGQSIKAGDRCKPCNGKKVANQRKVLEVNIDKGMKHGQKIVFSGEADQQPGTEPGDVVFVIQQTEHARFIRKGDDLLLQLKITLSEALCGATIAIDHLDARQIIVKTKPGEMIRPGEVKAIDNEGMPMHKNPFVKGKLYIKFDVEFPADGALSAAAVAQIAKALPEAPMPVVTDEAEEHKMETADISQLGKGVSRGQYDEDEDGEEGPGGQRVQCAQQ